MSMTGFALSLLRGARGKDAAKALFLPDIYGAADSGMEQVSLDLTAFAAPTKKECTKKPKVVSCNVSFSPSQDLHGYDSPWPAGGGKNKLPVSVISSSTVAGIVYTNNLDGTWTLSGKSTNSGYTKNLTVSLVLPEGTYTVSGMVSGNGSLQVRLFDGADQVISTASDTGSGANFTVTSAVSYCTVRFLTPAVGTDVNVTLSPMIEAGSSVSAYAPYANICPISGWQGAEVTVSGKNLLPDVLYQYSESTVYLGQNGNDYAFALRAGTYAISSIFEGKSKVSYYYKEENGEITAIHTNSVSGEGYSFTLSSDGNYRFHMYRSTGNGGLTTSQISKVQLEFGSTASSYTPYRAPTTSSVTFGQTILGGWVDTETGEGMITHCLWTENGTANWNMNADGSFYLHYTTPTSSQVPGVVGYCNYAPYEISFNYMNVFARSNGLISLGRSWGSVYSDTTQLKAAFANTPIQVVYPLATPIPFHVTPSSLTLQQGKNQVWAVVTNN